MPRAAPLPRQIKIAAIAASICLGVTCDLGPVLNLRGLSPAMAQTARNATPQDALAAAKSRVAGALGSGQRILLVELYGTSLYVFNANHNVGGPVVRALEALGFTSVLPEGSGVGSSGATSLAIEQIERTKADHVFFLNFSTSEQQVRDVETILRRIGNGRLYRLDTTTSVALSPDWTEAHLVPQVAGAIKPGG